METLIIGCDNAAVEMKTLVMRHLEEKGYAVVDMGVDKPENPVNYPTIARRVCDRIRENGFRDRGILICGTGIGMAISANKCAGIRAAVCHDVFSARRSVLSNNCNVLCMGARIIGPSRPWMPEIQYLSAPSPSDPELKVMSGPGVVNVYAVRTSAIYITSTFPPPPVMAAAPTFFWL